MLAAKEDSKGDFRQKVDRGSPVQEFTAGSDGADD